MENLPGYTGRDYLAGAAPRRPPARYAQDALFDLRSDAT